MTKLTTAILLILFLSQSAYAVVFEGLSQKDSTTYSKNPQYDGKQTPAKIDEILRNLFLTSGYESIRAETTSSGEWKIIATQNRKIGEIQISGVKSFSDSKVKEYLRVKEGHTLEHQKLIQSGRRVKEFYSENGFLDAQISIETKAGEKNTAIVDVKVNEGPPTILKRVRIVTSNRELSSKLESISKKYLDDRWSESRLSEMHAEMNEYLKENRYLSAELRGPDISISENR
ncbi:MAG: hypothetical protein KDD25_03475, partial [Bdellovibrionales bacterium]|nr:hypothetical protein [Bdellovibrionales bacterium]